MLQSKVKNVLRNIFMLYSLPLKWGGGGVIQFTISCLPTLQMAHTKFGIFNLVNICQVVLERKMLTQDGRRTTHDARGTTTDATDSNRSPEWFSWHNKFHCLLTIPISSWMDARVQVRLWKREQSKNYSFESKYLNVSCVKIYVYCLLIGFTNSLYFLTKQWTRVQYLFALKAQERKISHINQIERKVNCHSSKLCTRGNISSLNSKRKEIFRK